MSYMCAANTKPASSIDTLEQDVDLVHNEIDALQAKLVTLGLLIPESLSNAEKAESIEGSSLVNKQILGISRHARELRNIIIDLTSRIEL